MSRRHVLLPRDGSEQSPVGDVPVPLPEQRGQTSRESSPSAGERVLPNAGPKRRVREPADTHDGAAADVHH